MHYSPKYRRRFIIFPIMAAGILLLLGAVVMLLWNAILPDITGFKPLGYWQATGLLVLCRILFGSFRSPGSRAPFRGASFSRNKWMNMTEEERARFKSEWQKRCEK